jgi:hypothetical protein
MVTVTNKFAKAVIDVYVHKNSRCKLTGDRMKTLQLTLPFLLRDLLKKEAASVNSEIEKAKKGRQRGRNSLANAEPFVDPSDEIIEVLLKAIKWHLKSRQKDIPVDEVIELDKMGRELLEELQAVFPERTGTRDSSGEFKGWCFEKAHALLHVSQYLLLYGFMEVTSAQGPEHCHIDFVKKIGHLTNNKQVFISLMRKHARDMHIHQITRQLEGMTREMEALEKFSPMLSVWNEFCLSQNMKDIGKIVTPCELGMRYPMLQLMKRRDLVKTTAKVHKSF